MGSRAAAGAEPATDCPGSVDWERQVVKVRVLAPPDLHGTNLAQARLGAQRTMERESVRALLACLRPLHVDSDLTLGDELGMAPPIQGQLEAALKGIKPSSRSYFFDGGMAADVEVPLAAIAMVFAPSPTDEAGPGQPSNRRSPYTGWLLDAGKLPVPRGLRSRVLDTAGAVVYGPETLGPAARKARLPLLYASSAARAKAALGSKPLRVKVLKVQGVDLVISTADARKVTRASFLEEGRVAVAAH